MDVVVVPGTSGSDHRQWRRRNGSSSGHHVVAQLLESPLPTPRRSCCGRGPAADASSPQRRGHVPFKWESSPGVPKSAAATEGFGKPEREVPVPVPLPKPPPGRRCCGTCHARRHHGNGNATGSSSSSSSDDGDGTFSDALDRVSSSDRLAALSARLSAIDGGGLFGSSSRRRSPSFIMDRFLPAANAIATTSADKHHPRRPPPPRRSSKSKRDRVAEAEAAARLVTHIRRRALALEHSPKCQRRKEEACAALSQAQIQKPCAREEEEAEEQDEQMTPRACGFMFFVPWSAKPVLLGFQPARSRTTPRAADVAASVVTTTTTTAFSSSPPRRSVTLGDVLEKDRRLQRDNGGLSTHWYDDDDDEKSGSGKEQWASPGWGMALLGTSKRYCADARKALMSRLTRSGVGDGPRIGGGGSRERGSGGKRKQKQAAASMMLRSTSSVEMPPLSPPSESWLSNARRSNAAMRE